MTQAELANEITQEHLMGGVPAPISPHCTATLSISHFPVKCKYHNHIRGSLCDILAHDCGNILSFVILGLTHLIWSFYEFYGI